MAEIIKYYINEVKPGGVPGSYKRIIVRKNLLTRLKELFISLPSMPVSDDLLLRDPYGKELDRAWNEFEKRKIV